MNYNRGRDKEIGHKIEEVQDCGRGQKTTEGDGITQTVRLYHR